MSTCASMNCPFIHYCRHYHLEKDRGERCETQEAIIRAARGITRTRDQKAASEPGGTIREARMAAGMTQAELAAAAGVRQKDISRWEAGVHAPGIKHLAAIAAAVGTTIDDLI